MGVEVSRVGARVPPGAQASAPAAEVRASARAEAVRLQAPALATVPSIAASPLAPALAPPSQVHPRAAPASMPRAFFVAVKCLAEGLALAGELDPGAAFASLGDAGDWRSGERRARPADLRAALNQLASATWHAAEELERAPPVGADVAAALAARTRARLAKGPQDSRRPEASELWTLGPSFPGAGRALLASESADGPAARLFERSAEDVVRSTAATLLPSHVTSSASRLAGSPVGQRLFELAAAAARAGGGPEAQRNAYLELALDVAERRIGPSRNPTLLVHLLGALAQPPVQARDAAEARRLLAAASALAHQPSVPGGLRARLTRYLGSDAARATAVEQWSAITSEASTRARIDALAEAALMVPLAVTTGGAGGALAAGVTRGLGAGVRTAVTASTAANLGTSFAATTTASQLRHYGELSWARTGTDLALAGAVAGGQYAAAARALAALQGTSAVRAGARAAMPHALGVGVGGSMGVAVDVHRDGLQGLSAARVAESFGRAALLHGQAVAMTRALPSMTVGGAVVGAYREPLVARQRETAEAAITLRQALEDSRRAGVAAALGQGREPTPAALQAKLDQQQALHEQLARRAAASEGLRAELAALSPGAGRGLPREDERSFVAGARSQTPETPPELARVELGALINMSGAVANQRAAGERASAVRWLDELWEHLHAQRALDARLGAARAIETPAVEVPVPTAALRQLAGELSARAARPGVAAAAAQRLEVEAEALRRAAAEGGEVVRRMLVTRHVEALGGQASRHVDAVGLMMPRQLLAEMLARGELRGVPKHEARAVQAALERTRGEWVTDVEALQTVHRYAARTGRGRSVSMNWMPVTRVHDLLEACAPAKLQQLAASGVPVARLRAAADDARRAGRSWIGNRDDYEALVTALYARAPRPRHDLHEPAPIEMVRAMIAERRRAGDEVPAWLADTVARAERAGQHYVLVGKDQRPVIEALSRGGKPEPNGRAMHNLSSHHVLTGTRDWAADEVAALRQARSYKPPWPYEKIERYFESRHRSGELGERELRLLREAMRLQRELEGSP